MSKYAGMLASIKGLAENLQALNQTAVREYIPIVESAEVFIDWAKKEKLSFWRNYT
jgi:hypothetical protein